MPDPSQPRHKYTSIWLGLRWPSDDPYPSPALALVLILTPTQVKVAQRLGSFKGGADDVIGHSWFEALGVGSGLGLGLGLGLGYRHRP